MIDPKDIAYKIIKTERGYETIIVSSNGRELPLHSRINPERESETLSGKFDPDRFDVLIVLGVGLGYHLAPLSRYLSRYTRIVLIDILEGIEAAIARNPLTSFLLESERISFIIGKSPYEVADQISEVINLDDIKGISVLEHPASVRIFEDYYRSVKRSVEKLINKMAGNKATKIAFGSLYLRNIIKNIGFIDQSRPVMQLFGALAQYPAIIIAPGPSLETDIRCLKKHQARLFIVSVDSAVPVLTGHGIRPDLIISIDPQPYVLEHFIDCDIKNALGIVSISSHLSVLERLRGHLSLNSHPLSQLTSQAYGNTVGSVDSGTGSVAGDAVNLCLKCGFRSIGLAGLDFSFADYTIYARGTAYQKRYSAFFQDRFTTVESNNYRYIMKASGGVKSGGKFTRKSFLQYKESLEDFIQSTGARNIWALNKGGIPLNGVAHMEIEEFIARECKSEIDKRAIISSLSKNSRPLSSKPIISGLSGILHERLFDELIDASLNGGADERKRTRYRKMIDSLAH
jgi:hypothetical protein